MAESEIVKAIRKQREEVARNELATLKRLTRLWVSSYRYLQKQVNDLMGLIQTKRAKGETVEIEYIHSLDRYKTMMAQAKQMVRQYNKAVAGQIRGIEAEMVDLGHQNGRQLVSIAEPDNPMWTRVNKRETRIMAGMTAEESPLDNLLAKSFGQMKEGMEQALITGISTGQGSSWIADQLMQAAEIPERRALLIARTEVNRTYRQSNWEQMCSSRAILGYRRMCYPETACFACLMLDKEFYPVDSEPVDHPNGKCSFVPVTRHFDPADDPSWEGGREWFERQDPDTQRRIMGPGRYDLWKQAGVDPRDMVWIKPNNIWGGSPAVRPLKDLPRSFSMVRVDESDLVPFTAAEISKETAEQFFAFKRRLQRDFGIKCDERIQQFDYNNFSESISGLIRIIKDFPASKYFANEIIYADYLDPSIPMRIDRFGRLEVNPIYFGSSVTENINKMIANNKDTHDLIRYFSLGSIGAHEGGHMLVNLYASRHPESRNPAQRIVKAAMTRLNAERISKGLLKSNLTKEIEKISNRATITRDETIAEAIADYYASIEIGKQPRPLSKAICDVLKEELNDFRD